MPNLYVDDQELAKYLEAAQQAARLGGEVLREMRGRIQAREKGPADLVTEADLKSQQVIRDFLLNQFPSHHFVGEESDPADLSRLQLDQSEDLMWVVDPLDRTTNYVHGLNYFSVSVSLQRGRHLVTGAVYDPIGDECFSAAAGQGATCNGQPLRVSSIGTLDRALIAASFPAKIARGSAEIARFAEVLYRAQGVRRLGSAALNLCFVAAGRLDGYWATSIQRWDIAAGVLILHEAGGVTRQLDGTPLDLNRPCFAAAGQSRLLDELLAALDTQKGDN